MVSISIYTWPCLLLAALSLFIPISRSLECVAPLGMESRRIKDAQITASSEWDGNHAAIQGRLNFKAGRGKQGGWSARWNNRNQWIQVALGSYTKLTSIATQGRNAHNQWVTAYKLQYSDDGVNFYYYKSPGQSSPMILKGNRDRDSVVYHKLNPPINARYIRLRPTAWYRHISLRMELYGCQECSEPLGMEGWQIKDAQITASSEWDRNHAAIQGRLNFKAGGGKQGGWSARQNNGNQWIQVALGSYTKLTSIATQGRNAHNQWVTAYKLQYSDDGVNFYYYKSPGQSSPMILKGNRDRDSVVYHKLNPPIQARYIRLRPTAWYRHISLRMELYGCQGCSGPLGMESGRIQDAQITASSEWDRNHAAIQGRLNFKAGGGKQGGWSARQNNGNQWIQVALGSNTRLTSIATQGRNAHNQWVTAYKLQYSDDGVNFYYYKSPGQSSPMILKGNRDRDSVVYHNLNPPIQARYIRLRPTAWYRHISLRMEVYGCQECSGPLGMESRHIQDAQITASSEWDRNHAAIQGRLNFKAGGGKQGGWSARQNNGNQWIQVALGSYTKLTSIATQGRNAHNQWVTAYKLQYSDDGVNFYYYKSPGQSSPTILKGNRDRDSVVYHKLNPPIQARYIRLRPTAWYRHISLRMEVYGCQECSGPLGMESRHIQDAQITASSEWDRNHAAIQGRLNFKAGGGKQGGWSARQNNGNQWIQVALGSYTKLTSIATQGRNAHNQWVTAYKLQYSDDGVNFYYYKSPGQSSPTILKGNRDRDSVVYHKLNPPIQARYIRLRPTAWYRHISLRMEVYGCQECSGPLGMESRHIQDAQITASSEWDGNHAAIQGRLNFKAGGGKQGGWSARQNNGNQWIQVALGSYTKLTSIATQGRNAHNQWVTAYKLQYSKDGVNFYYYKVPGQSSPKVFKGNKNRDSIVYHKLNPPIKARYIKLRPTAWYGHISLRMELYGCSAASGINVLCDDKNMTIVIPKFLIRGLDPKNLRLLDTKCKGKEGRTHLTVTTPLTGCKTTSRYTPTAIIYSNTLEIPAAANSAVTRVRDIKVQFSCYYSTHGVVSSLGWKPINTTLEFHDMAAKGNLKLSLRMFHSKRFVKPYLKNDFPVAVRLHRRLFFEVSTATNDKKLSIRADQCYATPTQDQKNSLKYEFIKKGCPSDVTVKYHSAPSSNAQRFSVEAFKFIAAHPFVFVHCHVTVCSATDPRSKCSMKCPLSGRGKRELSDSVTYDVHSLVQGPLHLAHEKRKENHGTILDETGSQSRLSGGSVR